MKSLLIVPMTLLLAALASCAPTTATDDTRPAVALINAPAENRVLLVAGALEEEIAEVPGCCAFSFASAQLVRFQETHRDMFGSRAVPQSSSLARNLGASFAVMADAPRFEREVETIDGSRVVRGVVQLRAVVIDADDGESLATVASLTFEGQRTIGRDDPLPEVTEDPTMLELLRRAAEDLAPHLTAVLNDVSGSNF